jgi:hypothetical protein
MKTLSSIALVLFLASSLSASPRCERLTYYDLHNLKASFELDLVSNAWRTSMLGTMSTLYFQEDGLVIVIPAALEKVETYLWSLVVDRGHALLSFFSPTHEKAFLIAPTCNGISALANGRNISMNVSSVEEMDGLKQEFLRSQLTGTWHSAIKKSPNAQIAPFSLALNADGTFILGTGPDKYHTEHEGIWHVSPDGQYLILNTRVYSDEKEHYVAEVISLKSVDFEDMVIKAQSLPRALEVYRGKEDLYLSKSKA